MKRDSAAVTMEDNAARKQRIRKVIRSLTTAERPPPLPPAAYSRAAIVTTVRGIASDSLRSWCCYHLAVGFSRLFVYFDAEDELIGLDDERIICASLGATDWAQLGPPTDEWLEHAPAEVQSRQALNALHALHACVSDGSIAWLLHLDADELFFTPSHDVRAHFCELGSRGVDALTYANLEAVPEQDLARASEVPHEATTTAIPFAAVDLFKRNPRHIPETPQARAASAHWTSRGVRGDAPFNYYSNGKSVVRVAPRARPLSVHEWIPGSAASLSHWYSFLGEGDLVKAWPPPGAAATAAATDAAVLHFACCSSSALWQRLRGGASRYRLRGALCAPPIYARLARLARAPSHGSGSRLPEVVEEEGDGEEGDGEMPWESDDGDSGDGAQHDDAEQVVAADEDEPATIDDAELRRRVEEEFERLVVLRDADEAGRQIAAGVCVRVTLPANLFAPRFAPGRVDTSVDTVGVQ